MKSMVFDTGPVISLATNNLLWLLEALKKEFGGEFYITTAVEDELVKRPLQTKKFKFEALQVMQYIKKRTLRVIDNDEIKSKGEELLGLANSSFKAHNAWVKIVNFTEMEAVAAYLSLKSDALVVDERTTRLLIESPTGLKKILGHKLHTGIALNKGSINGLQKQIRNIKLIRSVELVTVAYELGLLDRYLADIPAAKKVLLESVLWGVKLNGCAVSKQEIEEVLKLEGRNKRFI